MNFKEILQWGVLLKYVDTFPSRLKSNNITNISKATLNISLNIDESEECFGTDTVGNDETVLYIFCKCFPNNVIQAIYTAMSEYSGRA